VTWHGETAVYPDESQHQWFIDSKSSTTNPKRNYYIWKKPKFDEKGNRMPPNNWSMILGGGTKSAWTWDENTQEYYLSLFTPEQPDLNWENPEVREGLYDILRFWLDRGASGFRMDVINLISKHPDFPDAAITVSGNAYQSGFKFYANGPRMHEYLQEMNSKVLSKYPTITVGEMPHIFDEDEILRTVGANAGEINMIFIFDIVDIDGSPTGDAKTIYPWNANDLKKIISRWQRVMYNRDGWNAIFCENHDTPRSLSRFCNDNDQYRELGAKLLCLMLTTLSGTLYVFQGQELGLRNIPAEWDIGEYKDIGSINYWKK
jgi:oligo-1,6-glucosidase